MTDDLRDRISPPLTQGTRRWGPCASSSQGSGGPKKITPSGGAGT